MNDQPKTIFAVTGYIGPNLMRGEWSTRRDDEDRTTAEYVLKSATDTRLAAAEAMAEALRLIAELPHESLLWRDIASAAQAKWRAGK